jgi:hypothetical protein
LRLVGLTMSAIQRYRGSSMCELSDTCQPFYDDDRRKLAEEIATALKAQGYRVTKNAVGDHSCAGPVNVTRLAEALNRVVVRVTMLDHLENDLR